MSQLTPPIQYSSSDPQPRITPTQWLVVILAAIGFCFDIYELLMLPLVVTPAIEELTGLHPFKDSEAFGQYRTMLFVIPAFAGGVFGLLGGYLTDWFGRRRVLTYSILLYAFSAFAAGFAQDFTTLLILRSLTFIGFCVEFVAAVAWVAELFPHPIQRERMLGYTQAFSSLGGLLVALMYGLIVAYKDVLPTIPVGEGFDGNAAWRFTFMSGVLPALPLILIRPFLPESPVWLYKRQTGTLRRPSVIGLFAPNLWRSTVITTIMVGCTYGAALGAIQFVPQLVPQLPELNQVQGGRPAMLELAAKQEAGTITEEETERLQELRAQLREQEEAKSHVQKWQEVGGLVGRIVFAVIVTIILFRKLQLWLFLIPAMIVLPLVFIFTATKDLMLLQIGMFVVGFFAIAQMSFWGNYLPTIFPTHLRGTGEALAHNMGGRVIGTSFVILTQVLSDMFIRDKSAFGLVELASRPEGQVWAAAIVGFGVYLLAFLLSFGLKEPESDQLPD
jgi:MFS family permease